MARTAGRNAEDTRRSILDAAATMIGRNGTAVPVSDIAKSAGVSKGGLLYHFPNKEALLIGLAEDLVGQFRQAVEESAALEPAGTPGRLARAYIKVGFTEVTDPVALHDYMNLATKLMLDPEIAQIAQKDADRWRAELADDGLEPAIIRLIIAATDGAGTSILWGAVLDEADRKALEQQLLDLTRSN